MRPSTHLLLFLLLGALISPHCLPQGNGSCGVHLDILANRTSTHSAVADTPAAPIYPLVPGAGAGLAGNPYQAYADYGTVFTLRLTVAQSLLGAAPFGPGSRVTILYAIDAAANVAIATPPGWIGPCVPGRPIIISVLPIGGQIVDGLGIIIPPPPPWVPVPADPGHPDKLEVTLLVPPDPLVVVHTFTFQAIIHAPPDLVGPFAASNGVSLKIGANPNEISVAMAANCGATSALDEGYGSIMPTPPGFVFYGTGPQQAWMHTNGFIQFAANTSSAPVACDYTGSVGDFGGGCAAATPTAAPRVDVNHFDVDLTSGPPSPLVGAFTIETGPPGVFAAPGFAPITWPTRKLVRWKNVRRFGGPVIGAGVTETNYASMACELWGANFPAGAPTPGPSRIVVVRQDIHVVNNIGVHDQIGIGPGTAAQGFGGPPPVCPVLTLWSDSYGVSSCAAAAKDALGMDVIFDSYLLSNLATMFAPFAAGGLYCVQVF